MASPTRAAGVDPGRAFLYTGAAAGHAERAPSPPAAAVVAGGATDAERWERAKGNAAELGAALEQARRVLDAAVFMDDEQYTASAQEAQYLSTIHAQQRRVASLERDLTAARAAADAARRDADATRGELRERDAELATLRQEQDNNAVVFKCHYAELQKLQRERAALEEELAEWKSKCNAIAETVMGTAPS